MSSEVSLQCEALLFDLDGVLVDSGECVERTWRSWAIERQLDPDYVMAQAHGRRGIEVVGLVAPHLPAEAECAALAEREAHTTEGIFEIQSARELLDSLPIGKWAIVTSGVRAVATLRLRHTRLPLPEVLICADEIQRGKPDPEGYLLAAERLGVAATACIVVEDAPAGLEAARAAGMRSIGVRGTFDAAALTMASYTIARLSALRVVTNDDAMLDLRLTLVQP